MRFFLLTLLLSLVYGSTAFAESITIANQNWQPLAGENLPDKGLLSKITQAAFKSQDIEVKYVFISAGDALEQMKSGKIQGAAAWTNLNQWSDDLIYSDPIMKHELVIYKRLYADLTAKPLSNLYGKRVGVQKGAKYNKLLSALIEGGRLASVEADSVQDSFFHLLTGKVDFCVQTALVGKATLAQNFSPSEAGALNHIESKFSMAPSYLIFNAAKTDNDGKLTLKDKFNLGLAQIQENGTYSQLIKDFVSSNTPAAPPPSGIQKVRVEEDE